MCGRRSKEMNLCNDNHDEICFDSRKCPLCVLRDDYETQINELEEKIISLESDISEMSK